MELRLKPVFKMTWFAFFLSVLSLIILLFVFETKGDTGIALWLLFMIVVFLISLPLHFILLISVIILHFKGKGSQLKWIRIYFIIAVVGHLIGGASIGAFDEVIGQYEEYKRYQEEPYQVDLENGVMLGSNTQLQTVLDALANGANPNGHTKNTRIPLIIQAVQKADIPIINALIKAGANPNIRSPIIHTTSPSYSIDKPTSLDIASLYNDEKMMEIINILLKAGADPAGTSLMLSACFHGKIQLYNLVVEHETTKYKDNKGRNCLHLAARTGQVEMANFLLNISVHSQLMIEKFLNTADDKNDYPLDIAILRKYYKTALTIAKAGGKSNNKRTKKYFINLQSDNEIVLQLQNILHEEEYE